MKLKQHEHGCRGWSNRPTSLFASWLYGDPDAHNVWVETYGECLKMDDEMTRPERIGAFAEELRECFVDYIETEDIGEPFQSILHWGLGLVNWPEIAEDFFRRQERRNSR